MKEYSVMVLESSSSCLNKEWMYVRFLFVGEICSIITEGWEEHKLILGVNFETVGIWIGNVDLTMSLNV